MTLVRLVSRGAGIGALLGAALGLVLGLIANPATAWFAILEVGIPAAGAGAMIGLLVGSVAVLRRRHSGRSARDTTNSSATQAN